MDSEFLTEREIEARYPGEWVLVEEMEIDQQFCLVRGVVTMHDPNRDVVERATRRYPHSRLPFTIQFFGFQPERIYLLGVQRSQ